MKRPPVLKDANGECRVCQYCLVKWARYEHNDKLLCLGCLRIHKKREEQPQ